MKENESLHVQQNGELSSQSFFNNIQSGLIYAARRTIPVLDPIGIEKTLVFITVTLRRFGLVVLLIF